MVKFQDLPMAEPSTTFPFSDDGTHWEHAVTVGHVGPGRRRQSDKVMTEIDKRFYVLPVVEIVVL